MFPPIADYAFLSDCHTGALVAPDGSVEWLCLPRFDSPSVFGALLDRAAGSFRLGPDGATVPVSRRYEPGTNIVETTWMTETGWLVVRDALTIGEWRSEADDPHTRPPTDHDADHCLVRVAECIQGEVELEMVCAPAPDYARATASWTLDGETVASADGALPEGGVLRLVGDLPLAVEGNALRARRTLREGEGAFCMLAWGEGANAPADLGEARSQLATTSDFWRVWLANGFFPDHPWRAALQRSALVLKGLSYSPTGALVAAATTSLPETPGGERNWDYRYAWIRDSTFALWGLHTLGLDEEARAFVAFFSDVCSKTWPDLQIMYGIGGERDLTERTLGHLTGYAGARPVRIGNAAFEQRQNDVYGALLDSVYIHEKALGKLPAETWELLKKQVEAAIEAWPHPDQGIWEARGAPHHYVSSKLMCWVALDRGARLATDRGEGGLADRWRGVAEEIRADVLARGVDGRGVFRQHYDTDALDASNLLIPLVRFLPLGDQRTRATVLAIADGLTVNGLVLRYWVEETDDGFSGEEGSFAICSFWLVSALSEIGEVERARELCHRLLSYAGPLGLYAEEIAAHSGRQLGNFPQAFTHLALINAVSHVIGDELGEERGPTSGRRRRSARG